jgi:DNA-directed RNA polymerase specialized sigma24 family protein
VIHKWDSSSRQELELAMRTRRRTIYLSQIGFVPVFDPPTPSFEQTSCPVGWSEVRDALEKLGSKERAVILDRFGFLGPEKSLEEIAKKEGVTREAIRQRQLRGIKRLKRLLMPS